MLQIHEFCVSHSHISLPKYTAWPTIQSMPPVCGTAHMNDNKALNEKKSWSRPIKYTRTRKEQYRKSINGIQLEKIIRASGTKTTKNGVRIWRKKNLKSWSSQCLLLSYLSSPPILYFALGTGSAHRWSHNPTKNLAYLKSKNKIKYRKRTIIRCCTLAHWQ